MGGDRCPQENEKENITPPCDTAEAGTPDEVPDRGGQGSSQDTTQYDRRCNHEK
jgi:hypothetical protein